MLKGIAPPRNKNVQNVLEESKKLFNFNTSTDAKLGVILNKNDIII